MQQPQGGQILTTSVEHNDESLVHHVFQREGGILRPTVRTKSGVIGTSTTFQKIGKGIATTKARHGVITPMNQNHTAIECTLFDFYAGDWVDKLDEAKLNIDEREAIAKGGAWALGRKVDDQIITELNLTSQSVQTLNVTSHGDARGTALDWVSDLWSLDVMNDGNVYGYITPTLDAIWMTITDYASADFVNDKPFVEGARTMRYREWLGVKWAVHTGANGIGTSSATAHVYHSSAIAYATGAVSANSADDSGKAVHADITWHGDRASHFINHWMSGGAKLIDDTGVVEATWDDTSAIPTT